MDADQLRFFVTESNHIEGIHRQPTQKELDTTAVFLTLEAPTVSDLQQLVNVYQPDAVLRDRVGLNVRVGNHVAPPGGPDIRPALNIILLNIPANSPWKTHVAYETLHPFTDGNGRSGRALWAWQMLQRERQDGLPLGFLHQFYYQTIAASRVT